MIKVFTTKTFDQLFLEIDEKIQKKAAKKTDIFRENPFDYTLRTEKLHPKKYDVWSFRVDLDYRIVFRFMEKGVAEFMFIGHHNQIYNYGIFR